MDIVAKHRLNYDSNNKIGTLFYLMRALSEFWKLWLTCINNYLEEAEMICQRIETVLDEETKPIILNR